MFTQSGTALDAAYELLEHDMSFMPVHHETKIPAVKWTALQERVPTEEEVERWFKGKNHLGLITGAISGYVVVDADNDAAVQYWIENGQWTPLTATTKRGRHFYYRHPGYRVGNRANFNRIRGLDIRGDGGYVLVPPSPDKVWQMAEHHDIDDIPTYKAIEESRPDSDMLDLAGVEPEGLNALVKAEQFVVANGKYDDGDGRNVAATEYVGELISNGYSDEQLVSAVDRFQDRFFSDHLSPQEVTTIIKSLRSADKRNHPDRYTVDGEQREIYDEVERKPVLTSFPGLISAEEVISSDPEPMVYDIEPWLIEKSIVQVHGYTGHGKSMFLMSAMWNLASGQDFGPYKIRKPKRVLYVDYDMSYRETHNRLKEMNKYFGSTPKDLVIMSSAAMKDQEVSIDLRTDDGWNNLGHYVEKTKPDVIVLDNTRTICLGLKENDAHEWSKINKRLKDMRDKAGLGVIWVHHSNKTKRDDFGNIIPGTEAGSTNQLTVVETQVAVSKLHEEAEQYENLLQKMHDNFPGASFARSAYAVEYGKVRNHDPELHTPQYVMYCRTDGGGLGLVSSHSNRQRAGIIYRHQHKAPRDIATTLMVSQVTVEEWLREDGFLVT